MAQQQTSTSNSTSSASQSNSNETNLYPKLESTIAALDENESDLSILNSEKELVEYIKSVYSSKDILEDIVDRSIFPIELLTNSKKLIKQKVDPLKKLKELSTEENDEEEEQEDEEDEEEQEAVEDEEEDAGGDYLVSHFDNGENFEENDDEDDDMVVN